ncbi:MAG: N-6 DNA methylase [Methanophagales archaeon]|nr:N-6 DNA methylase [Methanophagales archaeon]
MSKINELQFEGRVLNWLREIIEAEKRLPFEADQEVPININGETLRADLVIWEDKERTKTACIIELKRPEYNGYSLELTENAMRKANFLGAPFFATWNVNEFVLWETFEEGTPLLERRRWHQNVVAIKRLEEVERRAVEERLKRFLQGFLTKDFFEICFVKKGVPTLPLDRLFIDRLRSAVNTFYIRISEDLQAESEENGEFRQRLRDWSAEQGWVFGEKEEDFDRVARLSVLLLIAKVLFYNFLKVRAPGFGLKPIKILTEDADRFKTQLYKYFGQCFGYAEFFRREFVDDLPFPNDEAVVRQLKGFLKEMELYDLSKIGYEVLGSIFENLIPDDERHKFGQHFTRSDVVDLIIGFCVKSGEERVLDPACGAGTFLTRAYVRKKAKTRAKKEHSEILSELKGVEIAEFGCYLTRVNLAIKDIFAREFCSNVEKTDFFDLVPGEQAKFEAVVTNPPYTRQEELEATFSPGYNYKAKLKKIAKEAGGGGGLEVGKRMSIYGYFFFHAARFLAEKGRLGFVTSNSWLDVDYGKYLQQFFLRNFKVVAILESKEERWFEAADVNTCITILERCDKEGLRRKNRVKFVQLKKPLQVFVEQSGGEEARWKSVDRFVRFVEGSKGFYEDERVKIYEVEQAKLWEEGFDEVSGKYEGAKWGKYLRAPAIFFKILEKGRDLFVPLREVAEVRFGIKTGANEFFYLTEEELKKKWGIEREFWCHKEGEGEKWVPNYVIKSPRECRSVVVKPEDLKYRVLMIHKEKAELKGTKVLEYIEWGEESPREFHKRSTCASRKRWWDLPQISDNLLSKRFINDTFSFFANPQKFYVGDTFFCCKLESIKATSALLNSTLYSFLVESFGRTMMGEGVLLIYGPEIKPMPLIDLSKSSTTKNKKLEKSFDKLSQRPIGSVFEELGATTPEEVALEKVKSDRRELDEIVMGEILGLSGEEQLEVYRAVVDLVRSRLEKARSVPRKTKRKGVDVEALAEGVLREVETGELKKFPEDFIEAGEECREIEVPSGKVVVGSDLRGFFVKVGGASGARIECGSLEEAKFIEFAVLNGSRRVRIPKDERTVKEAVARYGSAYDRFKKVVAEQTRRNIQNSKLRRKVEAAVWTQVVTK